MSNEFANQEICDAVKRGAALLDKHFGNPQWRNKCEGFEFGSLDTCILGKLFGGFGRGSRELFGRESFNSPVDFYGFDYLAEISMDTEEYQQAWQDEFDNPPLGTDTE